jgi:uncharacterized membrane protein
MYPFIPLIAFAQNATSPTVKQLVWKISYNILNPLIKLGFVIALLIFIWGIVQYIRDRESGHLWEVGGNKGTSNGGAERIVWGLVGLFIMVSAFAIMNIIKGVTGSDIAVPQ